MEARNTIILLLNAEQSAYTNCEQFLEFIISLVLDKFLCKQENDRPFFLPDSLLLETFPNKTKLLLQLSCLLVNIKCF